MTTPDTSLLALRERVAKLTGPDWHTDALVTAWLTGTTVKHYPPATDFGPQNSWQFSDADGRFLGNEGTPRFKTPRYTASVDAVLALVDRTQPGWRWGVLTGVEVKVWAYNPHQDAPSYDQPLAKLVAVAPTPAIALLNALLTSLTSGASDHV
jgi:hypothetical protein